MSKWIYFGCLVGFLFLTLSGCAGWFGVPDAPPKPVVKETPVLPPPAPPQPELGSIWTENSHWNEFYSVHTQRGVGDVLFVKPTESFKLTVIARGGKPPLPSTDALNGAARETQQLTVTIRQLLPHDVYSIQCSQTMRVGNRDHQVTLVGKIREQDIAADDTTTTDYLFETTLDVKSEPTESERKIASLEEERQIKLASDKGDKNDKKTDETKK
jgi:flagellar basal body L-ring protein FlgH